MLTKLAVIAFLAATSCMALPSLLQLGHATSYSNSNLGHGGIHAISHGLNLGSNLLLSSHGHKEHVIDYHVPAHYSFKYGVEDHKTGDIKEQKESRDGDVVRGEYSLHEPDGTIRTVKYVADKHTGFHAQVIRHGKSIHPQIISQHGHHGW